MLQLKDIRDFLKGCGVDAVYSIGKINTREEHCIGIYQGRRQNDYERTIGSGSTEPVLKKCVSVLIHWNKNAAESDAAAMEVFEFLRNSQNGTPIGENAKVAYLKLLDNDPIDVSTDEFDNYERVIDFVLYYTINK